MLICLRGKGYTYTRAGERGRQSHKDGKADLVKRCLHEPVGMVSAAPGGAAGFPSTSACRKTRCGSPRGSARTIRAANPARPAKHVDYTGMDINEGGSSIPYWMEDPYIAKQYVEMLEKNGAVNRMDPQFYDRNYKGELPKE